MSKETGPDLPKHPCRPPLPNPLKVRHLKTLTPLHHSTKVQTGTINPSFEDQDAPDVLLASTSSDMGSNYEFPERPGRPPPPDPSRVQHLQTLTLLHQAKVHTVIHNQTLEDQDTSNYVFVMSMTSDKDQSTPLKTPLAPPPVTLNKSAQPGRPILSRSAAIVHEEHIYECIEDLLLEGGNAKIHVRPARPPPPNPLKVRHLQRLNSIRTEEVQAYNPLLKDLDIPEYVTVISEAAPPVVPPTAFTMWRKPRAQGLHRRARSLERSWDNSSVTTAVLQYEDVLQEEIRSTDCTTPLKPPPFPPPPRPAMLSPRRPLVSQSAIVEPVEHVYEFIEDVLPENKEDEEDDKRRCLSSIKKYYVPYRSKSAPSSVYRRRGIARETSPRCVNRPGRPPPPEHSKVRHLRSLSTLNKSDVPSQSTEKCTTFLEDQEISEYLLLTPEPSHFEDCITPSSPPPPVAPPRPALVCTEIPVLSQPVPENLVDHGYTYVTDVLTEDDEDEEQLSRSLPDLQKKKNYQNFLTWSKQSSVSGDSNAEERELLLEWWRTVKVCERIPIVSQDEETDTNILISTISKVKSAMRLYELLIFQHGTSLMNNITRLHCIADSFVKSSKKSRFAKLTVSTTGAFGGVAIAAGLALAPVTFGSSVLAAGAGVGVVTTGGLTRGSATVTRNYKGIQYRNEVDTVLQDFESQIKTITDCLKFIDTGVEYLRMQDDLQLRDMDDHLANIAQAYKEIDSLDCMCAITESVRNLKEVDSFDCEEDRVRSKRNSDRRFAEKLHDMAYKFKEETDKLIRVKNLFQVYNTNYKISEHFTLNKAVL